MFQEGNYDVTEFQIPPNGMNQFIAPDALPPNFCHLLENIIPSPVGSGTVRYGTTFIEEIPNPANTEFNIIRSFPFINTNADKQSILYVSHYVKDLTITNINIINTSTLNFTCNKPNYYTENEKIKIVYTLNGLPNILYSDLISVTIVGNVVSVRLSGNIFVTTVGLLITEIWYQEAVIYSYNFNTNTLSNQLMNLLTVACVPRVAYFQKKLFICNGVDDLMVWDGTNLSVVTEFVIEIHANTFTRINNTSFSFVTNNGFNVGKYFNGNIIKLIVNGNSSQLTILNTNLVGNVLIVNTIENLPLFPLGAQIVLYYQDKPPAFSYIYAAKDRLWALGPGAVGLSYRNTDNQLRVYYNYFVDPDIGYRFFNENTKTVPVIDMSQKHEIQDNFEAICQVNGFMVFMGRKKTQIWGGYTPGLNGNMYWQANLPIGILHGDLLIELANDTYFVSPTGINSFSTLNIAKQLAATPDNAVDTIVKNFNNDATSSDINYRKCTSFKYSQGGICGFKISDNKILASLFSEKLYSWFYLSGDFSASNCFMDFGSQFNMCIGNKIYQYADGNDGSPKKYGDKNGTSLISINWIPGLVRFRGRNRKRYANKRYEISINYPSSFVLNDKNTINISIFGDIPKSFSLSDKCSFEKIGDLFGNESLAAHGGQTLPGFRLRKEYQIVNKRLKFVSYSFWISISGYVMNGPVNFRKIRLFGVGERNA